MSQTESSDGSPVTPELKPEALIAGVGVELRRLRKIRSLTLEELARRASVSVGLVSQIERGRGNPSFNTLVQIAHALSVPIGRLFHTAEESSPVVRAGERRTLDMPAPEGVEALHQLLTPTLRNTLEALWIEAPPGYDTSDTPFVHPGEEFGVVLAGHHEVTVDGVPYELGPGDSITYPSTSPHSYRNAGSEMVQAIWVITPPTF